MPKELERSNNVVSLFQEVNNSSDFCILTISSIKHGLYHLIGSTFSTEANVSASCLLLPEVGDTVLVYLGKSPATHYILSVLVRQEQSEGTIQLPGNNQILAKANHMTLESAVLALNAKEQMALQAPLLSMSAYDFELKSHKASIWTSMLNVSVKNLSSFVKDLVSTVENFYFRAKSCFRFIDDFDDTQAGHQSIDVKGRYRLQSESVNLRAQGFVKIDGSKIDLG